MSEAFEPSTRRRDRIAQWAFDTHPILTRFHLWLEDVDEVVTSPRVSFAGPGIERALMMSAAVTALGTRLYGRFGEGRGKSKEEINRVKKDADAISAYSLSEALWYTSRSLPENHALMVCLGEGLMPKAGETPEMGANPLLGFGRVYARPQVASILDRGVHRLINEPDYRWENFLADVKAASITIWGAAIDTLENTSRFAQGETSGPMTVLHVFDQPLVVSAPYEGYVGTLVLPRRVVDWADQHATALEFGCERKQVLEAVLGAYPGVTAADVHVWTLTGPSRVGRLGSLWTEWEQLGVQLVEQGWEMPGGSAVFTDSGTYAPVMRVGDFEFEGRRQILLCDGYAASAEAIQAASLDPMLDTVTKMRLFSSRFELPWTLEREITSLDCDAPSFEDDFRAFSGEHFDPRLTQPYRESLRLAREADLPTENRDLGIDDFFATAGWRGLALRSFMLPDPYSGANGVEDLGDGRYAVTVHGSTGERHREARLTLRLSPDARKNALIFLPLLDRFYAGEDYRERPVKISDSGRIRNELQTLCSQALEHTADDGILVHMDRIDDSLMSPDKKQVIGEVLRWYRDRHPIWFRWLEVSESQ